MARLRHWLLAPCGGLSLASLLWAGIAYADQAVPSGATNDEMAEVIVTARRVNENAQTVPISISAFDTAALQANGIKSTSDLQQLVPGVIFTGSATDSNTTYSIRGQGKAVVGPGLPSVVNYFNDVPLPPVGSVLPTYDVSSVQVLKGPQGTLFGRNTTGGAVLVYSTEPDFKLGGYVQVEGGNFDDHSVQGAINLPIVDDMLAVRLAGDVERREGYTLNTQNGQRNNDVHSNAFRVSVLFKPTDFIKNSLVYDYYEDDTANTGNAPVGPALVPSLAPLVAQLESHPWTTAGDFMNFTHDKYMGVSDKTSIDIGGSLTVKNIFGFRTDDISAANSSTGLPNSAPLPITLPGLIPPGSTGVLLNGANVRHDHQFTEEFQLVGKALNDKLDWLVGVFYLDDQPSGPDNFALDIFRPVPLSPAASAIVNNSLGGNWPTSSIGNSLFSDRSKAVFLNGSYDLQGISEMLHGFKFDAGVRYTADIEGICAINGPLSAEGITSAAAVSTTLSQCQASPGHFSDQAAFKAPTYNLGLDYVVTDDLFLYFTTRHGYRAGGINSPALTGVLAPFQTFGPQKVTDFEVGEHFKWKLDGWTGQLNVAAFQSNFSNLQVQPTGISPPDLGTTTATAPSNAGLIVNAGASRVRGVELSGGVSPLPGLNVDYAATYLNSVFTNVEVSPIFTPYFNAGVPSNSPKWSYSAAVQYRLPFDERLGDYIVKMDTYFLDQYFVGDERLPSYHLSNVYLQWNRIYGQKVDLTVFVTNVFNKAYIEDADLDTPSFGAYTGSYGPPRMYGARITYHF